MSDRAGALAVLGLEEDVDAAAIRRRTMDMLAALHPDRFRDVPRLLPAVEHLFRLVTTAHEELLKPRTTIIAEDRLPEDRVAVSTLFGFAREVASVFGAYNGAKASAAKQNPAPRRATPRRRRQRRSHGSREV